MVCPQRILTASLFAAGLGLTACDPQEDIDTAVIGQATALIEQTAPSLNSTSALRSHRASDQHPAPIPGEFSEPSFGSRWMLWPSAFVHDTNSGRNIAFYAFGYSAPGEHEYTTLTTVVTIMGDSTLFGLPTNELAASTQSLVFGTDDPAFGSAVLPVGRTLYVYGCELITDEKPCALARVSADDVMNRNEWQFYGRDGWSSDIRDSMSIFTASEILQMAWNPLLSEYTAVYNRYPDNVRVMRTSAAPQGPWSEEIIVEESGDMEMGRDPLEGWLPVSFETATF